MNFWSPQLQDSTYCGTGSKYPEGQIWPNSPHHLPASKRPRRHQVAWLAPIQRGQNTMREINYNAGSKKQYKNISWPNFFYFSKILLSAAKLTAMIILWFSVYAPQHPKNAMRNMMTPIAMNSLGGAANASVSKRWRYFTKPVWVLIPRAARAIPITWK